MKLETNSLHNFFCVLVIHVAPSLLFLTHHTPIGNCITRVRPGDICPLYSVAFECALNTLTATLCQCDQAIPNGQGMEEFTDEDTESSGAQGMQETRNNTGSGSLPSLITDETPTLQSTAPPCLGKQ